jgi:hypothetical protein
MYVNASSIINNDDAILLEDPSHGALCRNAESRTPTGPLVTSPWAMYIAERWVHPQKPNTSAVHVVPWSIENWLRAHLIQLCSQQTSLIYGLTKDNCKVNLWHTAWFSSQPWDNNTCKLEQTSMEWPLVLPTSWCALCIPYQTTSVGSTAICGSVIVSMELSIAI